jgi:parallel beta-helix repeat protein
MATFYVNPTAGNNTATGTQSDPFKTLTQALQQATAGTTIQLVAGTYTANSGEIFPLVIESEITIIGDETNKGSGIFIEGSGEFISPTFSAQNITFLLKDQAQLRGVTVTNPAQRGTGIWVESSAPIIAGNTLTKCGREGIFVAGIAKPVITDNIFFENTENGMAMVNNAKGEVRKNLFQNTGNGLAIGEDAAPLVVENTMTENEYGLVINGNAKPVFRKNLIEKNHQDGISVTASAIPDLGNTQDAGENILRQNGGYDLLNATAYEVISAGNDLSPTRVQGKVEFVALSIPTPMPAPIPGSSPAPIPKPTPAPIPTPTPVPTRFTDIAGNWAQAFIQAMVEKGLISGFPDATFKPNQHLTRAEYAALLAKTFTQTPIQEAIEFSDIPSNFWAAAAIQKASAMGFIAGFPDGTFRPNHNLTRIQAIVSLVNGLKLTQGNLDSLLVYTDRAQIPSYAVEKVASATNAGLVVNYPNINELNPLRDITRAEIAVMIYQALVATNNATEIASNYLVKFMTSKESLMVNG